MPGTVADYIVLSDGPVPDDNGLQVNHDTDWDLDFAIPDTADLRAPILMVKINSTGPMNDLKAPFTVNGTNIFTYGPTDTDLTRPLHEVMPNGLLAHSSLQNPKPNKIKIGPVSGQGKSLVSDIILWFQNKV